MSGPLGVRPLGVRPYGRRAFLLELADQAAVHRGWAALIEARRRDSDLLAGVEEIVAGARTVLVVFGRAPADLSAVSERLSDWLATRLDAGSGQRAPVTARDVEIPVVYDGADLAEVAELTGLSVAEVVSRHTGTVWTVGFLGFAPVFAYLTGGDRRLAVPRRADPRPAVPAGAVALAGGMSAVYPAAMPGGWRLIGRTDVVLFDAAREPAALLAPGVRVRFGRAEGLSGPAPATAPTREPAGTGAGSFIEVVRPGPGTTVQDGGRVGRAHEGVPRAGAADLPSLYAANLQVGNAVDAAALELTLAGPTLRFPGGGLVGVAGADAPVRLDGAPVTRFPLRVPAGSTLAVGPARWGVRTYVAVAGGVDVPPVLGSRSADTLSGLGPAPLRAGDVLPIGPASSAGSPTGPGGRDLRGTATPPSRTEGVLRVRAGPGPRADRLGPGQLERLFGSEMKVSPVSDRVGLRTEGLELVLAEEGQVAPEGVVAGAVQVPPGGRPIILLANHATTGGYPVVAVVDDDDLPVLAQARPGSRLRLEPG